MLKLASRRGCSPQSSSRLFVRNEANEVWLALARQYPVVIRARRAASARSVHIHRLLPMRATKDAGTLMLRFVQDQSQPLRQVCQAVRFVDDRKLLSGLMTLQYFTGVARSEQDAYVLVQ